MDDGILNTILVVEDEAPLLQIITRKLTINNLKIIACTSAEQALDYLKAQSKIPDAIWLDYKLTGMNGLEFMQKLKIDEKWKNIPVIVVSNSASTDKVNTMLALGAKKYILKAEYRLDDIITTVKEFVEEDKNK